MKKLIFYSIASVQLLNIFLSTDIGAMDNQTSIKETIHLNPLHEKYAYLRKKDNKNALTTNNNNANSVVSKPVEMSSSDNNNNIVITKGPYDKMVLALAKTMTPEQMRALNNKITQGIQPDEIATEVTSELVKQATENSSNQ